MRRGLVRPLGALFVALLLTAGWGRASAPYLAFAPCEGHEQAARLAGRGFYAVRIVDGYALAWLDDGSAATESRLLAARDPSLRYAIVYTRGRAPAPPPPADFGTVLTSGPRTVVLEYEPRDEQRLLDAYEILPIPNDPICLGTANKRDLPPFPDEPDAGISELVEQVDRNRLLAAVETLQAFGTRRSMTPQAFAAGDSIRSWFEDAGLADVSFHDFNAWADNVVAVQEGLLHPGEIYLIGAHYDSYAAAGSEPGADDNASGTSAVIEAARILAAFDTEATIVYIAFCGEEQGLVGSAAWAAEAAARGLDIRAAINLDMIGYRAGGDARDLDVIFDTLSEPLLEYAIRAAELYVPALPAVPGYFPGGNSDQQSFWDHGFAAITLHEDSELSSPFIHTPQDRLGTSVNDPDLLEGGARVALAMLASLARPVRVRIRHDGIEDPPTWADGYAINATIESVAPVDPESLRVVYRVDGGAFARVPLRGGPAVDYEATIPRQRPGVKVDYFIHARDIEGREADEPPGAPNRLFSFQVGRAVRFSDDFESDRGWIVGAPGDEATTGLWTRAIPVGTGAQPGEDATPDSGVVCFVTGNGALDGEIGDADVDGGSTTLTSPGIPLGGLSDLELSFRYWFVDETYGDDTLRVQISWDDGGTWREIAAFGRSERAWKAASIDSLEVGAESTDRCRVRFVVADGGNPSLLEAALDDLLVRGVSPRIEAPPARISRIVQVLPNPFRQSVGIVYDLISEADVTLSIHDLSGRRVALLDRGVRPAGRYEVAWDCRDRDDEIANGIYFARLEAGSGRVSTAAISRLR